MQGNSLLHITHLLESGRISPETAAVLVAPQHNLRRQGGFILTQVMLSCTLANATGKSLDGKFS
jgi:hypothetical protein